METIPQSTARPMPRGAWDAPIHAGLEAMISAHRGESPVATFDWDGTCIRGDVGLAALDLLDAETGSAHRARYDELDETEGALLSYPYCTEVWGGRPLAEIRAFADRVIDKALAEGQIAERPEMRQLIGVLQTEGWQVWVVSASPRPFVEAFARRYGVGPERVCAQDLPVGPSGRLAERTPLPIFYKQGKVDVIDRDIRVRPTFAAGDSMSDLPMLSSARYALVTDAGSQELHDEALRRGWWWQGDWR